MDAYDERTIDVHFVTSTINPATATKANPSKEPSAALTKGPSAIPTVFKHCPIKNAIPSVDIFCKKKFWSKFAKFDYQIS